MNRMKRLLPLFFVTGLFALRSEIAVAQTADEVIEKHLTAIGGREALGKLTSRTLTGSITLGTPAGDLVGTIEVFGKAPNKARTVVKVDLSAFGAGELTVDQRFDGTTGYVIDTMNGNRDITGNQLENLRNATFPTPLLKYKENGTKAEVLGKEKIGDREVNVVQLTPASGSPSKQFFDAQDSMLLKTTTVVNVPQLGQDVETVLEFSDYRVVDGVKIAHILKSSNPVQTFTVNVKTVEHNKEIDDKSFSKPEK
jgi:hypothetical protein